MCSVGNVARRSDIINGARMSVLFITARPPDDGVHVQRLGQDVLHAGRLLLHFRDVPRLPGKCSSVTEQHY